MAEVSKEKTCTKEKVCLQNVRKKCCFLLLQGGDETCFDLMELLGGVELSWL